MAMSRPDEESKALFVSLIPDQDPRVKVRPMFGNLAGFVNGNMFAGLYGQQIFVRLSEEERAQLLLEEGASEFSPMPGRPMKEYVALPEQWRAHPDKLRGWIDQSLAWVGTMPEKVPDKKSSKKK